MFFPGETDLLASGRHIVPSLSGFLAYSHLSCSAKPLFIWLKFLEGTRNPWEKFALYIPLILRGLAYKHGIRVLIDEYTSSCLKQAVPLVLFCLKKGRDIHWVQCFPGGQAWLFRERSASGATSFEQLVLPRRRFVARPAVPAPEEDINHQYCPFNESTHNIKVERIKILRSSGVKLYLLLSQWLYANLIPVYAARKPAWDLIKPSVLWVSKQSKLCGGELAMTTKHCMTATVSSIPVPIDLQP